MQHDFSNMGNGNQLLPGHGAQYSVAHHCSLRSKHTKEPKPLAPLNAEIPKEHMVDTVFCLLFCKPWPSFYLPTLQNIPFHFQRMSHKDVIFQGPIFSLADQFLKQIIADLPQLLQYVY